MLRSVAMELGAMGDIFLSLPLREMVPVRVGDS